MKGMFGSFLQHACPDSMASYLSERIADKLHEEKLLLTLIDFRSTSLTFDSRVAERVELERRKIRRLEVSGNSPAFFPRATRSGQCASS